MLQFILKYKKYLIGALLFIALFFSFKFYLHQQTSKAYDRGYDEANSAWIAKGREYVDIIRSNKEKMSALNDKLDAEIEKNNKLQGQKVKIVTQKQIEYVKTEESKSVGIDDKFVDIYNESLGD